MCGLAVCSGTFGRDSVLVSSTFVLRAGDDEADVVAAVVLLVSLPLAH